MRIARFITDNDPRYAVVESQGSSDVLAVLAAHPMLGDLHFTGERIPIDDARLLAPIIPSKVIGIGRNYAEHAAELGNEVPAEPLAFLKPSTSVIGPGDPIAMPRQTDDLHFEGELAVVIGGLCRDLPRERVPEFVFGYTCANDVTARDLQKPDGQWWRAKGFDTFCPLGPWIVTDLDPADLRVQTRLDGDLQQDGRTSQMIHDVASLVAHVSSAMTLLPGDVILTGTPAGVGPMRPGQRVDVEIEGIGTLSNPVVRR